jgi:hypothetical protein
VVRIAVRRGGERGEGLRRRSLERSLAIGAVTPRALDGERLDFGYAVSVIADACELAKTRAGPPW